MKMSDVWARAGCLVRGHVWDVMASTCGPRGPAAVASSLKISRKSAVAGAGLGQRSRHDGGADGVDRLHRDQPFSWERPARSPS